MKAASPSLFERLVVELLLKMGYGGSRQDAGRAIGRSGDHGRVPPIAQDLTKECWASIDLGALGSGGWGVRSG